MAGRHWFAIALGAAVLGLTAGNWAANQGQPVSGAAYAEWTDSLYEAHTVYQAAPLGVPARAYLKPLYHNQPLVVVFLSGVDLRNCGDLGRQIRDLARATEGRFRIVLSADGTSVPDLKWFVRTERIDGQVIYGLRLEELWTEETVLPTPAAVAIDPTHTIGEGVGHIRRFPYVRPRSFAQELQSIR